jgi:hypothetical protein
VAKVQKLVEFNNYTSTNNPVLPIEHQWLAFRWGKSCITGNNLKPIATTLNSHRLFRV